MRGILARMHWLRGESDQAVALSEEVLGLSVDEHPFVLSQALATVAVPIALWRGEWMRAAALNERLMAHATCHAQTAWRSWAEHYRFVLRLRDGEADRPALLAQWVRPRNLMALDIIGTFDEELVVPLVLQRVESRRVGWCAAEILRAHAMVRWRGDPVGSAPMAEALLQRALHVAREQEALAWELRATTSLALLWRDRGQRVEARALLEPVLDRCHEGPTTLDVVAAHRLIEALRRGPLTPPRGAAFLSDRRRARRC
jgi:hypothetical protein